MAEVPAIVLVRHGETDWSRWRRHSGRTDVQLNNAGMAAASALVARLPPGPYDRVLSSPSGRARATASLAGFANPVVSTDLAEWDYGAYEGLTTQEIQQSRPGWNLFADGCPDGEDIKAVAARADRVIAALRADPAPTIIFSSAHFMRVLAARWAGWPGQAAAGLALDPASISVLGSEHGAADPVIRRWNDVA